mgnify:CR=1 FL=1
MKIVIDNWTVEATRPRLKRDINEIPFTLSSTIVLLYIGQTAEENPRLNPRIARQIRTHQKLDTRIAIIGKIVAIIPITIKD